jgi:F0F1-type ATP synthase assembly protein I
MTEPNRPADAFRNTARIYQVVSEFVAPIVVGLLVDWQFATTPWGTLVGTAVGLLVGGMRVAQMVRRLGDLDRKPKAGPP